VTASTAVQVLPVPGLPEIAAGDDLAALLAAALDAAGTPLHDGDVLVVASKIVAKAEGRAVSGAGAAGRDAAVAGQSIRVVAERTTPRGVTRIVESRSGPVLAAAGVDASNLPAGTVLLLPADPDGSAGALRAGLRGLTGRRVAVVVSDTLGRPWRDGQTDVAIGAAGLTVTDDLRGERDGYGNLLEVTVRAVADELAAAADLVKGKLTGVPVAVVRGLDRLVTEDDGPGAASLLRGASGDWFRLGHVEAVRAALGAPPGSAGAQSVEPPSVATEPVEARARRALALALLPRLVAPEITVTASLSGSEGIVRLTGADPAAVGAVAERLAIAAWSEGLTATLVNGPAGVTPGDHARKARARLSIALSAAPEG
jgi:coenzyme F420-0:L-glutamate ligase/coenzyme F420-1:gamma-L-glutamate ligase